MVSLLALSHDKELDLEKVPSRKRHPDRVSKEFSLHNLILEDPPPEAFREWRRVSKKWEPITNLLKKRRGKWNLMQHYENPKSAKNAMCRLRKLYRGQGFEFIHYEGKLWGRYVGTSGEESSSTTVSLEISEVS